MASQTLQGEAIDRSADIEFTCRPTLRSTATASRAGWPKGYNISVFAGTIPFPARGHPMAGLCGGRPQDRVGKHHPPEADMNQIIARLSNLPLIATGFAVPI